MPRVLLVQTRGRTLTPRRDRARSQQRGEEPRSLLLADTLGCDILDEETIRATRGVRGWLYRRVPTFIAQALEARRLAGRYDVVMSWSERHTVAIAATFWLTRARTPHLALMFWISKPSVRIPLRAFRRGVDRIITWSSTQCRFAIEAVGVDPNAIVLVRHPVDTSFFQPRECERTTVFSAGSTMRDFDTLVRAVKDLNVPVEIAASWVVVLDGLRVRGRDVTRDLDRPANVQVTRLDPLQLRDAYAAARVVVVPLLESDIDAGVNVILEAMAMARPVVVSRTAGQVDVVDEGVNGLFVPVGDARALRDCITSIFADPAAGEAIGARGRAFVEAHHSLEGFVAAVVAEVQELAAARPHRPSSVRSRGDR